MDLLKDRIRPLYFKYLGAAFGSALISSIYGIVDLAMVGKYQGAEGTAAISLISPVWNILYSLGLLAGIGGAVLFSSLRGESPDNVKKSNEYFTAAVAFGGILALLSWLGLIFFDRQLLLLFGANEALMPLARAYLFPVKFGVPLFIFTQLLSAFLRNDGDPALATKAVLFGGIFNVFGDYFFVFTLDMGIMGAGVATVAGSFFSLVIMLTHFFGKKNTLALVKPPHFFSKLKEIGTTGFSTFFVDVAMGILTVFFNRQVLRYFDTNALAVYGIVAYVGTFAQCCAYSAGQAAQPIISVNYGAGSGQRIRQTLRYALLTVACFGVFWAGLSLAAPRLYIYALTTPTAELLFIAPTIIRRYGISFLLLPVNIFSTYYFQALQKNGTSFAVSVSRGAVVSGILIYLLPAAFGADAIWFAMPVTEFVVAVYALIMMRSYTSRLSDAPQKLDAKRVITISREFGSGGRELGRRLADELHYAYYDQEIISAIARRTQLAEDYVQGVVECRPYASFPIHIGRSFQALPDRAVERRQDIYQSQTAIITELACRSDCVIVGRCADYILRAAAPFRIFVYADMESKLARCRAKAPQQETMSDGVLEKHILAVDRYRAEYYRFYTGRLWGDHDNYDLCLNTSGLDLKRAAASIAELFQNGGIAAPPAGER